ncbi:MAG: hypothetical protein AAB250_15985, partial [Bdellovibrionota bacterium]
MRPLKKILAFSALALLLVLSMEALAADTCRAVFNPLAGETLRFSAIRPVPLAPSLARPLETVRELRILQYNVENLFMRVGKFERLSADEFRRITGAEPKTPEALEGVARVMKDLDADIITMQELEGIDSLALFNKQYLNGKYRSLLIEGNDERGIDVGFLIKKDLPLQIVMESHKEMTWIDPIDKKVR